MSIWWIKLLNLKKPVFIQRFDHKAFISVLFNQTCYMILHVAETCE